MKSDEELKREWEEKLQERGRMLAEEEEARDRRKEKAQRMEKSYELMRLCIKTLELEGITWTKSKERRELERSRLLRIEEGQAKKRILLEKIEKEKIQSRITETLAILPRNRHIYCCRENRKRRRESCSRR